MKTLIVMRGPSGSGKSSYANDTWPGCTRCSADDYFYNTKTDQYEFDPTKLGQAHQWCLNKVLNALLAGDKYVVLDNTNIHKWEYENYELIAEMLDYRVEFHEFHIDTIEDLKFVAQRNTHGVPDAVVALKAMQFEPEPDAKVVPLRKMRVRCIDNSMEPRLVEGKQYDVLNEGDDFWIVMGMLNTPTKVLKRKFEVV